MIAEKVEKELEKPGMNVGRKVLKITVSEKNILVTSRVNTYQKVDYQIGFSADFSKVRRNETSPLTYHKTLNYGDCLLEKRLAKERGINEPIFLNMQGAIAEGATTNVFFVKGGKLFTPPVSCGLLPGILRGYICDRYEVEEKVIYPEEVPGYEEMFLTNSLLGVMPVNLLETYRFLSQDKSRQVLAEYKKFCLTGHK